MKPGRNDPCPCGSGKKFKHCCEGKVVDRPKSAPPAETNALIALFNAGRYAELEIRARALLGTYPASGIAWKLLAGSLKLQEKNPLSALQKSAELMPNDAEIHNNLGNAQREIGQLEDALKNLRRALKIKPDYAGAHYNLGMVLHDLRQIDEAVASYRRALQLKPDFADALYNLGNALKDTEQLSEAAACYRRAVAIKPDFTEAYINLGFVLNGLRQPIDAAMYYRQALEINPDSVDAHNNLGIVLADLCQYQEAVESYRRALALRPDNAGTFSNLLFCLNHIDTIDPIDPFAEHLRFGEQFEAPLRASWPQHANLRDPERCLRVGFVSADFRNHAVAHFFELVLMHLAQSPKLSLHAYYNHTIEDSVTRRLRGYFPHWHAIANLSDEALAQQITRDGIDILYDLSGHTAGHRLLTFAHKPAPVQVSCIGYPGTTGLSAMDYYQSDRFLFPDDRFNGQFIEKIVRLPAASPFSPSKESPPVNELPALNNGYLTFGSFNRTSKISRPVIALWAQLLRALPDSKILLGAMPTNGQNQTLAAWFSEEGIAPERVDFHPQSSMENYLGLHHQVDICLDTFPYNGGTTTFHALWMGVPTLTLAGHTLAGWAGASILCHVGLEAEFAASDAAEFVRKGAYWAEHLAELSDIRAGLRERFAKSARGQPDVVAASMERAMGIMWHRWCAGLPAESFEVSWQDIDSQTSGAGR